MRPDPRHGLVALVATACAALPLAAQDSAATPRRVAPRYGAGQVWIEPLPMTPREIAALLSGKSEQELVDSAVASLTQKYLDAMAAEVVDHPPALPAWTTSIGGQEVGIDSRWIHLGPLKIPTMLLALLPINVQPNPTEAALNAKLGRMREDLLTAGRRAANLAEFKEAVKKLRAEKEAEHQFEERRRVPPADSSSAP